MASFSVGTPAEILCEAIRRRDKIVEISAVKRFNTVLEEAYRLDPRIIGSVAGWEGKQSGAGLLSIKKTYRLELKYQENVVEDIDQVTIDDGKWTISSAISKMKELPDVFQIVTKDVNALQKRLDQDFISVQETVQGLRNLYYQWTEDSYDGYTCVWISLKYVVDREQYHLYTTMTQREVERVNRQYFGTGKIPPVIKAYLAFSYLQQTCSYDQEMEDMYYNENQPPLTRPWTCIAYGPLVKKMGTSAGIARAFKEFMGYAGIECLQVQGQLVDDKNIPHCWNMVLLNERYYHVDCTYGINGDGIYIGGFLKDDINMSETHLWDTEVYPKCTSRNLDFDFIESYVNDHMDSLIRMGVEEKYLCPEEVRE